jgi:hypothetical protein
MNGLLDAAGHLPSCTAMTAPATKLTGDAFG